MHYLSSGFSLTGSAGTEPEGVMDYAWIRRKSVLVKPTCPAHVVREGLLRERGMDLATGGTGCGQAEWEYGPAGPLGGLEMGARGLEAECGVRCALAPRVR